MVASARRLSRLLPGLPRRRYTIFAGTNTAAEWWQMARGLVRGPDRADAILEYERQFAQACGATHAISFGAGRMALYAILEALGIGPGDEVIVPAFTCVVVPNAILYRGARPVYVDIDERTFNIDVAQVEAAITPRTRALYAQHTFGVPCDVDGLRDLGRRHGLPIIEDGAHALGATYHGAAVGSLTDVAFFSTDHSKVISTHLGGMAVTSDDVLATRLRTVQAEAPFLDRRHSRKLIRTFLLEYLCFHPRVLWLGRAAFTVLARLGARFGFEDELRTTRPTAYPYPCRLSAAQAELGVSQLNDLARNLAHRREIAASLEHALAWNRMTREELFGATWLRYSFLVHDRAVFEGAFARRFDLGIWFTSVTEGRTNNLAEVGYVDGSCPVAEHVARHIVNLPTHLRIPVAVIEREVAAHASMLREQVMREPAKPAHA